VLHGEEEANVREAHVEQETQVEEAHVEVEAHVEQTVPEEQDGEEEVGAGQGGGQ
jgi:hypothetical protein